MTLTVEDDKGATNSTTKIITVSGAIFDTGSSRNPYPSIMGVHKGTIKPNHTVIATKLYTYACEGTGGHTEYARIWNETWEATATWKVMQATGITSLLTRQLSYWQAKHTSMKSEQALIRRFTTLMRCSQQTDG